MFKIKMVELKTKGCVPAVCVCETILHPHHHTTTTTNALHHHHHHHHHPQATKMPSGPHASRIVRKYRRSRLKRVKKQEYKKLRDMVPALQERAIVTKVEVIEEAIKYIDELHTALIQRFRAQGLPDTLRDLPLEPREVHGGNIRELVRHLLASSNPASLPPARIENARTLPSFIQKLGKTRRC
ncbi:uncharacterized protein [Procambarus clarkii]|uniref:uncharacterized protein n=1 Tax=Procambarus clarkii TaxID=6728 RepID=UPI001E677EB4|nr:uncharacterized protein LOC123770490 [Procambarus clarkii]